MSLEVIKGPLDVAPAWSPSSVTFVRTKIGLRELGEPRVKGSFSDQLAAWIMEKALGGPLQYWQVDVSERAHPEVQLELFGQGGSIKFDIRLNFNIRVLAAKGVLEKNIRGLDGYFTPAWRREIMRMANARNMAQASLLQQDISNHFGGGCAFSDGLVQASHLTIQVQPGDQVARNNMITVARVPTEIAASEADVRVTQAEMDAFACKTGGMTIDGLARAAIATNNPQLISAYNNLRQLHIEEEQRNWERLKFLVDSNLLEPHDLEKHLGPLGDEIMRRLVLRAGGATAGQKRIGNT